MALSLIEITTIKRINQWIQETDQTQGLVACSKSLIEAIVDQDSSLQQKRLVTPQLVQEGNYLVIDLGKKTQELKFLPEMLQQDLETKMMPYWFNLFIENLLMSLKVCKMKQETCIW